MLICDTVGGGMVMDHRVVVGMFHVVFFFFKQKTAYEMRISDWSSDVCSSDLGDQNCADHQQESKGQHHHRGISVNEPGQRIGRQQHHADRYDDRDHHHR